MTSIAAGRIGDSLGRRGTLFSGAVVFAVGGAVQTLTSGFWVMVIGRIIAGFGVGLLSFVEPDADQSCCTKRSWICQDHRPHISKRNISTRPRKYSQKMVDMMLSSTIAWCSGVHGIHCQCLRLRIIRSKSDVARAVIKSDVDQLKLQWIDYFCSFFESDYAWRIPLSVQCIIGALLAAGSLAMPESPR